MKIYTKTGDKGETSLVGGKRVSKTDLRIEAYGTVDELLSLIGMLREFKLKASLKDFLLNIQNDLMTVSSILASDSSDIIQSMKVLKNEAILKLEKAIDEMNEGLDSLYAFVIPGGSKEAATCHLARTVCRRAERSLLRIQPFLKEYELTEKYLNRLSDYLFVLSRKILSDQNLSEILWHPVK